MLARRLAAFVLALPAGLALILVLALLDREVAAPSWLREEVEARAAEAVGGGIEMDEITVVLGRDLHPRVRLYNARITDRQGQRIARIPRIDALISPRGVVLERTLLVQQIEVAGAEIAIERAADGRVAVAFGQDAAAAGGPGLAGMLAGLGGIADRPVLAALEAVRARDVAIAYEDRRAGRAWRVEDGRLTLAVGAAGAALNAALSVTGDDGSRTALAVEVSAPRGGGPARVVVQTDDARAADIATQSPGLNWLSVLDAPLDARIEAEIGADGALGRVRAALDLGAGALRPSAEARPLRFDRAQIALGYAPGSAELSFERIAVTAPEGEVQATGTAYLRADRGGLPGEVWGQFEVSRLTLDPAGIYDAPLVLRDGSMDLKLALDPFELRLGSAVVSLPGADAPRATASGTLHAGPAGWRAALDARVERIALAEALVLWPEGLRPGLRGWLSGGLRAGTISDLDASLRADAGGPRALGVDFAFDEAAIRVLPQMPPIEDAAGIVQILDRGFAVTLDAGRVRAPEGGTLRLGGSTMVIPVMGLPNAPAEFELDIRGPLPALLSTVDRPPLRLLSRADLPVRLAEGEAAVTGRLLLPLSERITPESVSYVMEAALTELRSDVLVPGRTLAADRLTLLATPEGLQIDGPARLSGVPLEGAFRKSFAPGTPALIEAQVEISQRGLDAFGIALPDGTLGGTGRGDLTLEIGPGEPPRFGLVSDLNRVTLALPAIGWSKSASARGRFEISGRLGAAPRIDALSLRAPGLSAEGAIDLGPAGRFDAARFASVTVGDWLDAAVTLSARGDGAPVGVAVSGGRLDLRRAAFGGEGGGGSGGPLSVVLDRLQVTEKLALTDFTGSFTPQGGLDGSFTAQVNGGPQVEGQLVPWNGRTGIRLTSADAGAVLTSAGLLTNVRGGALDLTLQPAAGEGTFDGLLRLTDIRVQDAPAIAELLDAISVVGLLTQLDGRGLSFPEVEVYFRMTPDRIIVRQSSAVGPSLGLSLDGTYTHEGQIMDFQGVVSPVYLLNGIGAILTRPGEGLIGFNFTLRGAVGAPQVGVNPLSALTPGMFREIFRRPPPQVVR